MRDAYPVLAPLALVALVALLGLYDPSLGSFAALVGAVVLVRLP